MPRFTIAFTRTMTIEEMFIRTIEADDLGAANKRAVAIALAADEDAPDDCREIGSFDASGFEWVSPRQVDDTTPLDDPEIDSEIDSEIEE